METVQPGTGVRRWRLFASVFLVYLAYAVPDLLDEAWPVVLLGAALMVAFVGCYLGGVPLGLFGHSERARRWTPWAMAAVTAAYLVLVGAGGVVFGTYLCVAFVVLRPPRVSVPLVLGTCGAAVFLPQLVPSYDVVGEQWSAGVPALLTALVMYGVRANAQSQVALQQSRAEVERLSAEQERLRIARDLHDLLGHALTTVVVKADLAARLAPVDAERAAREMTEVAALARQGLADVRATVAGYREVSLVTELANAREVLRASGIQAELPPAVEGVPTELRELFGWVVREGVTNAVRHSRAGRVRVTVGPGWVSLEDDGVGGPAAGAAGTGADRGSGLAGLRERVAAAGGRLTAGPVSPHGWCLRAEVPAP